MKPMIAESRNRYHLNMTLREVWRREISPRDYEAHMAEVGQAEANAALVRDLFTAGAGRLGLRVLIAGAGTGQMFDYIPPEVFAGCTVVCSDIRDEFLKKLRERFPCETQIDDVEDTRLEPRFDVILLVLVLEHVDWRRALASLAKLQPMRFLIVIQRNPPGMTSAVSPGRTPPGTMRAFAGDAQPHLVPFAELAEELAHLGYGLESEAQRPVADGKSMVGAVFARRSGQGIPSITQP
jgi:SAM-dependent methyltransferase